jgi:hypothetical protein
MDETRNCETARKFFASMRYTSQYSNSPSIETSNLEPAKAPTNERKIKLVDKFPTFHTSHFFQSITES